MYTLFSFKGRIGRTSFWLAFIPLLILFVFVKVSTIALGLSSDQAILIASCLLIWPVTAVQVKRWHDRDKSGWWVFITWIPVIGFFWAIIENGFLAGTKETNRFDKNKD